MNHRNIIKCKCCGNDTHTMTIYEMMQKATYTINSNKKVKKFINFFQLNLNDISISQNRSRLNELSNFEVSNDMFTEIYFGKSPIKLLFNESFDYIQRIELDIEFFKNKTITTPLNINSKTADTKLNCIFKESLLLIDKKFKIVSDELSIKNGVINLILPNERFNQKYYCNFLPDTTAPYIYFKYERDGSKISNIDNLYIGLKKYENENSFKTIEWLNQKVISMYPDYGSVCFWYPPRGTAGGIEGFEEIIGIDSKLYKDFEEWMGDFYNCEENDFDWNEFNAIGKKLHKELQSIVKNDYIIVYYPSYEEIVAIEEGSI